MASRSFSAGGSHRKRLFYEIRNTAGVWEIKSPNTD